MTTLYQSVNPSNGSSEDGKLRHANPAVFPYPKIEPLAARKRIRVCLVTPEIVGPTVNGGVGTAYTTLAQILADAGHEVTVLYAPYLFWREAEPLDRWQEEYRARGILLVPLKAHPRTVIHARSFVRNSYECFLWLKHNEDRFDIVHFPEWQGVGYYSLVAKHQGLGFCNTTFCVGTHSPTLWVELGNRRNINYVESLDADFLERESVRLADVVWSPSQYLLRWMQDDGWVLPREAYVAPYAVPSTLYECATKGAAPKRVFGKQAQVREIVFFGRLEPRKGLVLFCDAIDSLAERRANDSLLVTFLGRPWHVNGIEATKYIDSRARKWPFRWKILTKARHEALQYFQKRPGAVAVMPSIHDNYPNTVLECLAQRVPFLAAAVGGVPEQIASEDRDRVLFPPRSDSLAEKLENVIVSGAKVATPSFSFAANNETLIRWHEQLATGKLRSQVAAAATDKPLVSVCVTHCDRPAYLRQALESLLKQDYSPFEVIVVDDGSKTAASHAYLGLIEPEFRQRGWRIVRQENRYLGAARNEGARHSQGKYLLFMDDDNYAVANELSTLVAVAERTQADVLTCVKRLWSGEDSPDNDAEETQSLWLALGAALGPGLYSNVFGDANALIRREVFEALGGFKEVNGVTCEDWEFFARAVLAGFNLQCVPLPLFWYRVHGTSLMWTTDSIANHLLAIDPYLKQSPRDLRGIMLLSIGQQLDTHRASSGIVSQELLSEIDALWESRSWRWLRPLRKLQQRLSGLPSETKPVPESDLEAARIIIKLRNSLSWELTSVIRAGQLALRMVSRR